MNVACSPWSTTYVGQRHEAFRADLDAFTRHDMMRVAESPFNKASDADISRVHPTQNEVWDFRSLMPPGIRCFGRFGGLNMFIALTFAYREDIEPGDDWLSSRDWVDEIALFEREWKRLFGDISLFRGENFDEYLTNYIPC